LNLIPEKKESPIRRLIRGMLHPGLVPWAGRGVLAIADQGLFAGSNLLLNVFLARWLSPTDYGVFALAYSVFVLFSFLHSATLVEPMLVFGPAKYKDRLDEYMGILVRGHFLVMLPVALLTAAVGIAIGRWSSIPVGHALLALAWTSPIILLSWLLRRAFYVELQPVWATFGGILYLAAMLGLLFAAHSIRILSAVTALALMSGASLIASLFLIARLRPRWHSGSDGIKSSEVATFHWRYGRWSVAAAAVAWIPVNIYYLLMPAWVGLAGAAALRALMNVINPVLHVLVAVSPLLIPVLVRNRMNGPKSMNRTAIISLTLLVLGAGFFSLSVWLFRTKVFQLLYGGKYQESSIPLMFLLLSLLAACVVTVLSAGQMAMERPDGNFWSYVASSAVTILVGLPLAAWRGVEGAAEGLFLSSCVAAGSMYIFFRRAQLERTSGTKGSDYALGHRTAKDSL
jgi:O-antigen/teichoic acid export membrane protein